MKVQDPFIMFASYDEEIERKNNCSAMVSGVLMDSLISQLQASAKIDVNKIKSIYVRLMDLNFRHGGASYLNHPIRVAACVDSYLGSAHEEDIILALVHNLFEQTGGAGDEEIKRLLGPAVTSAIRLLTIDRTKERDPVYLSEYYRMIKSEGRNLMVLKVIDKMDNLLGWTRKAVDPFYYDVIEKYANPMLGANEADLRSYVDGLLAHVRNNTPRVDKS